MTAKLRIRGLANVMMMGLSIGCSNEPSESRMTNTKSSGEDGNLELTRKPLTKPDLNTPPPTLAEYNASKFKVNPHLCGEIDDRPFLTLPPDANGVVKTSSCVSGSFPTCADTPKGLPAAASLNPQPARSNAAVPQFQNFCKTPPVVDVSQLAQVRGVEPKSSAWPTVSIRGRQFFAAMRLPSTKISLDVVNDPDAQASRLLGARTVCQTVLDGSYRLPRPGEFSNSIMSEVRQAYIDTLTPYLEEQRKSQPQLFASAFAGFNFKSPAAFNGASAELKTRAIAYAAMFELQSLPDNPYVAMMVDDRSTTYPQLQIRQSVNDPNGLTTYKEVSVNLDLATDNYKPDLCFDRCGKAIPGCDVYPFVSAYRIVPIIKCLYPGQYQSAAFVCVKN